MNNADENAGSYTKKRKNQIPRKTAQSGMYDKSTLHKPSYKSSHQKNNNVRYKTNNYSSKEGGKHDKAYYNDYLKSKSKFEDEETIESIKRDVEQLLKEIYMEIDLIKKCTNNL